MIGFFALLMAVMAIAIFVSFVGQGFVAVLIAILIVPGLIPGFIFAALAGAKANNTRTKPDEAFDHQQFFLDVLTGYIEMTTCFYKGLTSLYSNIVNLNAKAQQGRNNKKAPKTPARAPRRRRRRSTRIIMEP